MAVNGNPIEDTNTMMLRKAIGDLKNAYAKGKRYKIQMKSSR